MRFNISLLLTHAHRLIENADESSPFHSSNSDRGTSILFLVNYRWAQRFMIANRIVCRAQTGNLLVIPVNSAYIEKSVAFHHRCVKRGFESGSFVE